LKLYYDKPFSKFAFNSNLRCYMVVYLSTSQVILQVCNSAVTHGVLNSLKRAVVVALSLVALGRAV